MPAGALTKLEEVEGKRCRMKLYAGEPILSSKLLGTNESIGAAKDIPAGYRVAHVKVDAATGSSNLILPGDRVDVLVFRTVGQNDMQATAAKIVLQDIKVFAVDTHTETEYTRNKSDQIRADHGQDHCGARHPAAGRNPARGIRNERLGAARAAKPRRRHALHLAGRDDRRHVWRRRTRRAARPRKAIRKATI